MAARRILATSGGFVAGAVQRSVRVGKMLLDALALTGATRPRVWLPETASADDASTCARIYEAFHAAGCDVSSPMLFPQPSANPEERLLSSELVWGGGSRE